MHYDADVDEKLLAACLEVSEPECNSCNVSEELCPCVKGELVSLACGTEIKIICQCCM